MRARILVVGYDRNLLLTRAGVFNTRWSARIAHPHDALSMLEKEPFELVVLCHCLAADEAALLACAIRRSFPNISVLVLETPLEAAAYPPPWADASSLNGPSQMLDAIEALLGSG